MRNGRDIHRPRQKCSGHKQPQRQCNGYKQPQRQCNGYKQPQPSRKCCKRGQQGEKGEKGERGEPGIINYSMFFRRTEFSVGAGLPMVFGVPGPNNNVITTPSSGEYLLPDIGVYEVTFQIPVDEGGGQFVVSLDDFVLDFTLVGIGGEVANQVVGLCLVETIEVDTILKVINPLEFTITVNPDPPDMFLRAVSQLIIKQLDVGL